MNRTFAARSAIGLLLLAQIGPLQAQATRTYRYDANGNSTQRIDPLNHTQTRQYDALNRLLQSTDPANGATRYGYNAQDQATSVTDPRSLATSYSVDGLGNVLQTVSPDSGSTAYAYDLNGNLTTKTDARSKVTTYTYDALNRLTQESYADGSSTSYSYDSGTNGIGRLTGLSDESGSTSWGYEARGRVTNRTQSVGTLNLTVQYAYDSGGRLSSIIYPSGNLLSLVYDGAGQVNAVTLNGMLILSNVSYLPFGAPKAWTWGNGKAFSRSFDSSGQMTSYPLGAGGVTRNVQYDAAGRITGFRHPTNVPYDQNFGYDTLDRLTGWSNASTSQSYTYDANSNRSQLTIGANPYAYTVSSTSNRLTATAGPTPAKSNTYDAAGNLLSDGSVIYTYSDRGRLASATKSGVTTHYLYNGLGQRVAKVGSSQPGGRLNFVYDEAGHLLGEYDGTGKVVQEVVWLGDLPIATIWPSTAGAVRYFIQPDHLGTPRIITNVANAIVWRWDWSDPFGVNAPQFAPAGAVLANFNLRFPGQYADKESNTFYNYFRNYSPQEGRYLQSDPIGLQGGINTYGYVEGNPVGYGDPFGLDKTIWWPVGPGRNILDDGPRNGNWCGGKWSGGVSGGGTGTAPPLDSLDECCQRHDQCYDSKNPKEICNKNLFRDLKALPDDSRNWPKPPKPGTEGDSDRYRRGALIKFGP